MRRIIWNSLETTLRNVQTVAELKAWRKRLQRTSRPVQRIRRWPKRAGARRLHQGI